MYNSYPCAVTTKPVLSAVKRGDRVGTGTGTEGWAQRIPCGKLRDAGNNFSEKVFPIALKVIHLIRNIYNSLLMFQEKKIFSRQYEGIFGPRCL